MLSQSFLKLQEAQERFSKNIFTLSSLKASSGMASLPFRISQFIFISLFVEKKDILLPFSKSVYVKGAIHDDNFIVDIGTGYYLRKVSFGTLLDQVANNACRTTPPRISIIEQS